MNGIVWLSTLYAFIVGVNSQTTGTIVIDPACDVTKGCLSDCSGTSCSYQLTWRSVNEEHVQFEISSAISSGTDHWAAIGFSDDRSMGSDSVVACIGTGSSVSVEVGFNNGRQYGTLPTKDLGLSAVSGSIVDSVLKCSFTRMKYIDGEPSFYDIRQNRHVLFARGQPASGNVVKHTRIPISSEGTVDFQSTTTLAGAPQSCPLVKAHGSLMIVAWVLFGSIGIFTAKYLKPVWPERTILGKKVWFPIHRGCMGTAVTLTLISFIIIFVEVGGYASNISVSYGSQSIGTAHPILGIIVTILAVTNPTMAMFRCAPDDKNRHYFNVAHWACGTSAYIIAGITIVLGTYLTKSGASGYVTPFAVAYFWVFILVNVIFDIYRYMKRREAGQDMELVGGDSRGSGTGAASQAPGEEVTKYVFGLQIVLMFIFALILVVLLITS